MEVNGLLNNMLPANKKMRPHTNALSYFTKPVYARQVF
jgi:hypothetical protein